MFSWALGSLNVLSISCHTHLCHYVTLGPPIKIRIESFRETYEKYLLTLPRSILPSECLSVSLGGSPIVLQLRSTASFQSL